MSFRLPSYREVLSSNPGLDRSATFRRGGSAYTLVRGAIVNGRQQRLGWEEAERRARQLGGNLITINDAAENGWATRTFAPIAFDPCGLWIGLNDIREQGTWEWSSGETSRFRNWVPAGTPGYPRGEPTNGPGEDFVHIYFNPDARGRWKDTNVGYRDVALGGSIAEIPIARVLPGGAQDDTLKGGAEADRIIGRGGNDVLRGRGGNDDLVGGAGVDVLTGGPGRDHFIYTGLRESAAGGKRRDRITDFDGRAGDRIDLPDFRKVRFEDGLLEVDVTGSGKADFALTLAGVGQFNPSWIV